MSDEYTPSGRESRMAQLMDGYIDALLKGRLEGIAFVAVDRDGNEGFYYLNNSGEPKLKPVMSKLVGLYDINNEFNGRIDCPAANRSYRSH